MTAQTAEKLFRTASEALNEGVHARREEFPFTANPYTTPEEGLLSSAWMSGWVHADRQLVQATAVRDYFSDAAFADPAPGSAPIGAEAIRRRIAANEQIRDLRAELDTTVPHKPPRQAKLRRVK